MTEDRRFTYSHANCGGPVVKEPCGTKVTYTGLHGWHCTKCGQHGVTVTRKANHVENIKHPVPAIGDTLRPL